MKNPPETWFWSHDIKPTQIDAVVMPGTRLVRLSSYGEGTSRRLAALIYKEPGPERGYAVDLPAEALAARLGDARPVAITASAADDGEPRFTVVFENGPGPLSSVHLDLDDAGLGGLVADQHAIADLATYTASGRRRFAAIVEERTGPSWVWTGITAHQLDAQLLAHGASLVRLRSYVEGGAPRFAAVAERARGGSWAWYADLDGDAVARNLESNAAYPVDLDAIRTERGVRFTVIMHRER